MRGNASRHANACDLPGDAGTDEDAGSWSITADDESVKSLFLDAGGKLLHIPDRFEHLVRYVGW
ncbi:MAG: hypothetical protein HYS65_16395 [Betaproteobacteria bacterium]|nr:hypothetical protein [Betaproteobacteria bacterium]MBI2317746.1 hypothetical protein [Betaproteobacteria bacterium]